MGTNNKSRHYEIMIAVPTETHDKASKVYCSTVAEQTNALLNWLMLRGEKLDVISYTTEPDKYYKSTEPASNYWTVPFVIKCNMKTLGNIYKEIKSMRKENNLDFKFTMMDMNNNTFLNDDSFATYKTKDNPSDAQSNYNYLFGYTDKLSKKERK